MQFAYHIASKGRQVYLASLEMSRVELTTRLLCSVSGVNGKDVRRAARRLKRDGLALVVVDYLQLLRPENACDPRHEQVATMSRRLKAFSRELKVPVLCLCQLNRQAEKDDKPKLSHLRESGAIEQDADVVLLLHRPETGPNEPRSEGNPA